MATNKDRVITSKEGISSETNTEADYDPPSKPIITFFNRICARRS